MERSAAVTSQTEYRVADFIDWDRQGRLTLNPHYQRRSIWSSDAKSYLIDTMLLGFPIPKIFLRSRADPKTQVNVRDVVDGQQRLRAILGFSRDEFSLNKRSEKFRGMRYSDLPDDIKSSFLEYQIGVDQFIATDDAIVLETFARLNSYNMTLNSAEKRHAKFQTDFKWFIRSLANNHRDFLTDNRILTTQSMLRMGDDEFFAELANIILNGVGDGGSDALNRLYRDYSKEFTEADRVSKIISSGLDWMEYELDDLISSDPFRKPYHVQMIFAAWAHQQFGLPQGRMPSMPERTGLNDSQHIRDNFAVLAQAIENVEDSDDSQVPDFVKASRGATTRLSTRRVRFEFFSAAISKD